jgi:hypothetical protein
MRMLTSLRTDNSPFQPQMNADARRFLLCRCERNLALDLIGGRQSLLFNRREPAPAKAGDAERRRGNATANYANHAKNHTGHVIPAEAGIHVFSRRDAGTRRTGGKRVRQPSTTILSFPTPARRPLLINRRTPASYFKPHTCLLKSECSTPEAEPGKASPEFLPMEYMTPFVS